MWAVRKSKKNHLVGLRWLLRKMLNRPHLSSTLLPIQFSPSLTDEWTPLVSPFFFLPLAAAAGARWLGPRRPSPGQSRATRGWGRVASRFQYMRALRCRGQCRSPLSLRGIPIGAGGTPAAGAALAAAVASARDVGRAHIRRGRGRACHRDSARAHWGWGWGRACARRCRSP